MPIAIRLYQPFKLSARSAAIGYSLSISAVTVLSMRYMTLSASNQRINKNRMNALERNQFRSVLKKRSNHLLNKRNIL